MIIIIIFNLKFLISFFTFFKSEIRLILWYQATFFKLKLTSVIKKYDKQYSLLMFDYIQGIHKFLLRYFIQKQMIIFSNTFLYFHWESRFERLEIDFCYNLYRLQNLFLKFWKIYKKYEIKICKEYIL